MPSLHHRIGLASFAAMSLGCAMGTGAGELPRLDRGPVELRVENRGWSDAAIYLVANGVVRRIGLATAVRTTTLWVPERAVAQADDIRIVSAVIGSNRSHITDPLLVEPGQLVQLTLENNLGLSSWGVW